MTVGFVMLAIDDILSQRARVRWGGFVRPVLVCSKIVWFLPSISYSHEEVQERVAYQKTYQRPGGHVPGIVRLYVEPAVYDGQGENEERGG